MALLLVLAALSWIWWVGGEQRALLGLPAELRAEVYARTLADLRDVCSAAATPEALGGHCAEQARFLLLFPECDHECRRLAQRQLPAPLK